MSTDDRVAAVALRLPRRQRARLAEKLLSSLEEPEETVEAAWAAELVRRSRDVAEGRVKTIPWETVRAKVLRDLRRRRADRPSS